MNHIDDITLLYFNYRVICRKKYNKEAKIAFVYSIKTRKCEEKIIL